MEIIDFVIDLLNEYIINKAFNKKERFLKKLPYIVLYFLITLLTSGICLFIGINYIITGNIFGYFITGLGILFMIFFILPLLIKHN